MLALGTIGAPTHREANGVGTLVDVAVGPIGVPSLQGQNEEAITGLRKFAFRPSRAEEVVVLKANNRPVEI